MKYFLKLICFMAVGVMVLGCGQAKERCSGKTEDRKKIAAVQRSLTDIVSASPGEIGVALIVGNTDTVVINNEDKYALMSVFKLHQALALCDWLERKVISPDTLVEIERSRMNPDTWSPMLKEIKGDRFRLSARQLMRYTLIKSDNNASNLMFERFSGVAETDSFIARIIPRDCFKISVTEGEMCLDRSLCYSNHSSPLGVAILINKLFADSIVSHESQQFICNTLAECATGSDRISAPLQDKPGVKIFHKTGSGYVNEKNLLIAHNDAAYISLPNGVNYTLVVLVKDFPGNEKEASAVISKISSAVYGILKNE